MRNSGGFYSWTVVDLSLGRIDVLPRVAQTSDFRAVDRRRRILRDSIDTRFGIELGKSLASKLSAKR